MGSPIKLREVGALGNSTGITIRAPKYARQADEREIGSLSSSLSLSGAGSYSAPNSSTILGFAGATSRSSLQMDMGAGLSLSALGSSPLSPSQSSSSISLNRSRSQISIPSGLPTLTDITPICDSSKRSRAVPTI